MDACDGKALGIERFSSERVSPIRAACDRKTGGQNLDKLKGEPVKSFSAGLTLTAAFVGAVGCNTYVPPVRSAPAQAGFQVSAQPERVWKDLIRYFGEHNVPIENMDHSSFFMKTSPILVQNVVGGIRVSKLPLKNEWCDCGEISDPNYWSSSTEILVSFNVILEPQGDGTLVRLNVFYGGGFGAKTNLRGGGNDVQVALQCVSTGKLEAQMKAYLQAQSQ